MDIQFKKGVLDLCVLSLLKKSDCYGYELVNKISNYITISEGTIYPLLKKITGDGLVKTYLKESTEGPPRKYYTLTERGHEAADKMEKDWMDFSSKVNDLLRGEQNE